MYSKWGVLGFPKHHRLPVLEVNPLRNAAFAAMIKAGRWNKGRNKKDLCCIVSLLVADDAMAHLGHRKGRYLRVERMMLIWDMKEWGG